MSDEKKRILRMLSEGKISSEEALQLLDQIDAQAPDETPAPIAPMRAQQTEGPRMFRVHVVAKEDGNANPTNVNINLPLKAARIAGRLLNSVMPHIAREALEEEGIDLSELDINELIDALEETGGDIINVTHNDDEDQVVVRVYIQ